MKKIVLIGFILVQVLGFAQKQELNLTNAFVVAQIDKSEDRYTLEVALTELLAEYGIKAMPSMNILKVGSDQTLLVSDSISQLVKSKGFDTYVLVSVRGFDKRFKASEKKPKIEELLAEGHLFPIYRDEVVSVSFEFFFYRNGQYIGTELVKCGNISSRDSVMKRFRKKISKRIEKAWK